MHGKLIVFIKLTCRSIQSGKQVQITDFYRHLPSVLSREDQKPIAQYVVDRLGKIEKLQFQFTHQYELSDKAKGYPSIFANARVFRFVCSQRHRVTKPSAIPHGQTGNRRGCIRRFDCTGSISVIFPSPLATLDIDIMIDYNHPHSKTPLSAAHLPFDSALRLLNNRTLDTELDAVDNPGLMIQIPICDTSDGKDGDEGNEIDKRSGDNDSQQSEEEIEDYDSELGGLGGEKEIEEKMKNDTEFAERIYEGEQIHQELLLMENQIMCLVSALEDVKACPFARNIKDMPKLSMDNIPQLVRWAELRRDAKNAKVLPTTL
jgi:hypothetical protein